VPKSDFPANQFIGLVKKGKSTPETMVFAMKHCEIWRFPVKSLLNQSNEQHISTIRFPFLRLGHLARQNHTQLGAILRSDKWMSRGSNCFVCNGNLNFKIQESRKITSQLSPIYLNYTVNVHLNLQTFCPPPIFRVIRSQVRAPRTLRGVSMAPGVRQTVSRTNSPVTSNEDLLHRFSKNKQVFPKPSPIFWVKP
jgi:hypothetical protein